MGKIKKILETELVGGTQSTDVYPVTSTKAVYDENNVRLDTILKPATEETAGLMSPEDKKNIDDKLSKSEGGEVNKHIVVTNKDSNYSTTINPDGSIYVWNKSFKDNILIIKPSSYGPTIGIEVLGRPLILNNVSSINNTGNMSFDFQVRNNDVYAGKFIKRYATDKDVLLGDGSTTDRLIKDVTAGAIQSEYNFNFITTGNVNNFVTIKAATSTTAGVMTAADKAKLDAVKTTYLPLSGGKMTGTLDIDFDNGIRITETATNPRNTYIGNGSIRIESLDGDTSRVQSKTEIDSNSITTANATVTNKVKANGFLANNNGNGYTAWTTNGGNIDLLNLLSNAAIYVAGGFELAESGIDNTTVVDSPDRIIYDETVLGGRFLARKGMACYTHWKADISKNIAPPSRYGIETDGGVFPFSNQMYKFSNYDNNIFIATCSDGKCTMKHLQ